MELAIELDRRTLKVLLTAIIIAISFLVPFKVLAQVVVASTSLTGAIAQAAGAREVRILTPPEVKHPPEYELKPSDLKKLEGADAVVYAGYERMVSKLLETSRAKNLLSVQIDTATSPENLIMQVEKLGGILKKEKEVSVWKNRFLERLRTLRTRVAAYSGKKAVVHFHAQPFSEWAGLAIVQVIKPGEITPKSIAEALAKEPEVVVDILHFPTVKVIADNAGCRYVQVINFPGIQNTKTLDDIFEFNVRQLTEAFR